MLKVQEEPGDQKRELKKRTGRSEGHWDYISSAFRVYM